MPATGLSASASNGVVYKNTVVLTAITKASVLGSWWWITENGFDIGTNPLKVGGQPISGVLPNMSNGGFTITTGPLSVGTHAYYATATQPGNILPPTQLASVTVNVARATPTIAWTASAAITYGTVACVVKYVELHAARMKYSSS